MSLLELALWVYVFPVIAGVILTFGSVIVYELIKDVNKYGWR